MNKLYEIWKKLPDSDVEISNFGEVRTIGGFYYSTFEDKHTGYIKVNLEIKGVKKQVSVHSLVAKLFVPNPFNKPEVNHKNGDKTNNCQWNLEWNTEEENLMHKKFVLGKSMNGENNPMYGKTGKDNPKYKEPLYAINSDGEIVGEFYTQTEAAKKLFNNVNISNQISRALSHKRNSLLVHGYYFLYKSEYEKLTQADLKPCELLEHPEVWANAYRGQSATKPQNSSEEGSTTIESIE